MLLLIYLALLLVLDVTFKIHCWNNHIHNAIFWAYHKQWYKTKLINSYSMIIQNIFKKLILSSFMNYAMLIFLFFKIFLSRI